MLPGKYIIPPTLRGDWWDGIPSILITVNDQPPVMPIASARLQFRRGCEVGRELVSPTGIVIEDAPMWRISIPAMVLALKEGTWKYDLETTDSAGVVKTYITGEVTVIADITQ